MVDLQVIEISDVLQVTRVTPANMTPRSVTVQGRDFRTAKEIRINEMKAPAFTIVNNQVIVAQVPPALGDAAVRTVVVISYRFTSTEQSKIEFRIGDTPKAVAGIERLSQTFLKMLLQTPGSDVFSPKIG